MVDGGGSIPSLWSWHPITRQLVGYSPFEGGEVSMSISEVPVLGVIADEYAFALESMLLRKAAIAWLALMSIILMCDCLNCRLFGMIEKCMHSSVALGGNGKLVVLRINVRISSGVVFIGTVK